MSEDPEIHGGESGGDEFPEKLVLKRSELLILRRMATKYPIVPGERQEAVDCVMDIIRTSHSRRHKLTAVNTLASLDRVNHDEIKMYMEAHRTAGGELTPAAIVVNNNVVVQNVTSEGKFLERAAAYQAAISRLADGGNGKPLDTAHPNGSANGVHAKPGG